MPADRFFQVVFMTRGGTPALAPKRSEASAIDCLGEGVDGLTLSNSMADLGAHIGGDRRRRSRAPRARPPARRRHTGAAGSQRHLVICSYRVI